MTFFHFINCVTLAYAPYFIAYKYSALCAGQWWLLPYSTDKALAAGYALPNNRHSRIQFSPGLFRTLFIHLFSFWCQ
ncbi:hypothetical protein ANCCAN_27073 [Ancylostoma caninum]|uniref:Uncharacterized protein n=1 Tax=Ancylostoma caninum TaxID=29170 RepID=A0A368F4Y3_ANCCA|nr:hypothetical protein ANCCAN_27073 [Ancylostoma caninum]